MDPGLRRGEGFKSSLAKLLFSKVLWFPPLNTYTNHPDKHK